VKKVIAILRPNLLWLGIGLAATAVATVLWVWGWSGESGFNLRWPPVLGFSVLGMLVASWRIAHNDAATALKSGLRERLAVIASVNLATLAVVTLTAAISVQLYDIDPQIRGMLAILPLPFSCILTIAAVAAACVRRERT